MGIVIRKKIIITLAGGGYENEARMLLKQLGNEFDYAYVSTQDTAWHEPNLPFPGNCYYQPTPISLGSPSRFMAAGRFLVAIVKAMKITRKEKPDFIIGVASPVCLPLFVVGRLVGAHCIFVESITRTDTLSLTGRIASHFCLADRVYVQWPKLASAYPGVAYEGTVI
jgi:UDP-N-acetylglucosamine:LPS N-acetylglucosamine transferase